MCPDVLFDSTARTKGQVGNLMRTYGLRFDVNCSILFTELPVLARPAAARAAGFDAVEFWWPFEEMVPADADADAFVAAIADAGVELDAVAIENLTLAADAAAAIDASVLVEAINSVDAPAFPVDSSEAAITVIDAVPAGNIAFLADLYHLGKMGEDLPGLLARDAADIAHIQIADVPDRGAPGTGTLDFEELFAQLAAAEYGGWIGCEYKPSDPADSSTSFGWM
jgi:hydroxypyruvate isomerase